MCNKIKIATLLLLLLAFCLTAGAAPKACPPDMAAIVGFYQGEGENILIRERGGRLELLYGVTVGDYAFDQSNVYQLVKNRYDEYTLNIADPRDGEGTAILKFERDKEGVGVTATIEKKRFTRRFFPTERGDVFTIAPVKDIAQLRSAAKAANMPGQPARLLTAELVEINTLEPGIRVDMPYARKDNLFNTPVYESERAFLEMNTARALQRVHKQLAAFGLGIVVWDAYRPWYISKTFYDALPDKDKKLLEDPQKGGSPHNRGTAVDVSLYTLADGQTVGMPSNFDEPSLRATRCFQGGSELLRWRRDLLRLVMENEGFTGVDHEWWHYDYKEAAKYRLLNTAFSEIK